MYHYQLWRCMMLHHGVRNARARYLPGTDLGAWAQELAHPMLLQSFIRSLPLDGQQAITQIYRKLLTHNG